MFVDRIESSTQGLEFDSVLEDISFYGIYQTSNTIFRLCLKCIVSLSEIDFIVNLEDIEYVFFERVITKNKKGNFDMNLLLKD